MKRMTMYLSVALVLGMALSAVAGEGHKCTAATQECLDYMTAKMAKTGYEGLDGEYDQESGIWTVTSVHPGAPAEAAGFKLGDQLYAVDGKEFASMSKEDWKGFMEAQVTGASFTYTLKRLGKEKTLEVTLVEMPADEIAEKIGEHMMQHVAATVQ